MGGGRGFSSVTMGKGNKGTAKMKALIDHVYLNALPVSLLFSLYL